MMLQQLETRPTTTLALALTLLLSTLPGANDQAGSAAGDAAQYAKDSVNSAKDAAGQFAGHASNTAQGKQGGIWDKVKNVVTGHSNDAANAGETAGEYVNSARNTAGQYAQDAKNQADHQSNKAGKYAQVWHLLSWCDGCCDQGLRVCKQNANTFGCLQSTCIAAMQTQIWSPMQIHKHVACGLCKKLLHSVCFTIPSCNAFSCSP